MVIKISVIINCLNGEKYISEAIDSVLNQTYRDFEIVVWDNQSEDNTAKIVKNYNSDKIRYHLAPKSTDLGVARNLAVRVANFEWIAFLDSDDFWEEDKLQSQITLFQNCQSPESVGLIYGKTKIISDQGLQIKGKWDNGLLPQGNIFKELSKDNFITLSSAVFRKQAFLECGDIPSLYKACEDYFIFLGICKTWKALVLQKFCCNYRWHSSNLSHSMEFRLLFEERLVKLKWDPDYSFFRFTKETTQIAYKILLRQLVPFEKKVRKRKKGREVLIWGTGEKGKKCFRYLTSKKINVSAFVDTNKEKQNSTLLKRMILEPKSIEIENHFVVVSSMYYKEIEELLINTGLSPKLDFLSDEIFQIKS